MDFSKFQRTDAEQNKRPHICYLDNAKILKISRKCYWINVFYFTFNTIRVRKQQCFIPLYIFIYSRFTHFSLVLCQEIAAQFILAFLNTRSLSQSI